MATHPGTATRIGQRFVTPIITQVRNRIRKQAHWCRFQLAQHAAPWHLRALRRKKSVRVVFLASDHRIWHAQSIYEAMRKDSRFDPLIVVYPSQSDYSEGLSKLEKAEETCRSFTAESCPIERGWRIRDDQMEILAPTEFDADILFYSSPYYMGDKHLDREAWCKHLCCYIPYGLSISRDYELQYNRVFHNSMWRIYCPDEFHRHGFETYGQVAGRNAVVTGYPPFDLLRHPLGETPSPYGDNGRIRLIWAPHHTICAESGSLPPSHFFDIADDMMSLASRFADRIFWAFRPHPALKQKLYDTPSWGKERTDRYYSYWRDSDHTALSEGEHVILFRWSDAMIHDSGTFLVEYSYTGKPVLYLRRRDEIEPFLSDLAREALDCCKLSDNIDSVDEFLRDLHRNPPTFATDPEPEDMDTAMAADRILFDLKTSIWGRT